MYTPPSRVSRHARRPTRLMPLARRAKLCWFSPLRCIAAYSPTIDVASLLAHFVCSILLGEAFHLDQ
jgi:hypothetical protein